MSVDTVVLQILSNHCRAAAESMAYTLFRTAHSTFVKETEDFTTGLTTPEGDTFATPTELGATWFVGLDYANVIEAIDDYREGDICLTNDPYSGFVCTHSPDLHLWKPIFHEGRIVCFAVGHIHNTDVGGAVPASLSRTLTEVHQEGIRLPPMKLLKEGEFNDDVLRIMLNNVRMPEQNWGDLKAQIAAMNTGERKVHEMIGKFGIEIFRQGTAELLELAEQQARNIIREIPDGSYFFADYMDEDSVDGVPCRIALDMIVDGDQLIFDFTGSDPQVQSSLNIPTGGHERHTLLMVAYVYVLYTLDKTILMNSGLTRAVRCILPEGTIVNPTFPAAVGMRSLSGLRLQDVIFGCFSLALPEKMAAGPASGGTIINIRTTDNKTGRRLMAAVEPISGGGGGMPFADGAEGSGANTAFLKNTPVEINEAELPIQITDYGLAPDSGGAGRYRGGLATELGFKVFAPDTVVTARNRDRTRFSSWGVVGGRAGAASSFVLNPGSNREENLANTDVLTVGPGDVLRVSSTGGGGWGDPLEREVEAVLGDVERGFLSKDAAERDYGVVLSNGGVDGPATEALRQSMRPDGESGHFGFDAERIRFENLWTRENYAALTEVLAGLPVHWRFFVKHRIFEAIEAQPEAERAGDGDAVRAAFELIRRDYPQLARELA